MVDDGRENEPAVTATFPDFKLRSYPHFQLPCLLLESSGEIHSFSYAICKLDSVRAFIQSYIHTYALHALANAIYGFNEVASTANKMIKVAKVGIRKRVLSFSPPWQVFNMHRFTDPRV